MDFTFTEEQETLAKVARQLFEHRATPERLTELEAGDVRYDGALRRELASADLLGIALPEHLGGSGHGFLELALLLTEVGWSAAEAGARVAATAQQVHGGIGIDTSYPLFRYFLWAKHNELTLGSASAQLARLGAGCAEGDR